MDIEKKRLIVKIIIGVLVLLVIISVLILILYLTGVLTSDKKSPSHTPTTGPTTRPTTGPTTVPTYGCTNNPSGISPVGSYLKVNDGVTIYTPKVACTPVTCLAQYGGQCQSDGTCKYSTGYKPLLQFPKAYATNYCDMESGGCSGALGDPQKFIGDLRQCLLKGNSPEAPPNGPIDSNTRFGVTANPPIMIGDSNESYDLVNKKTVTTSYQGSTPYSGICYDVKGPTGRAILVPYDRCAGYCKTGCGVSGFKQKYNTTSKSGFDLGNVECGICLQKPEDKPKPNCPCVGTTPMDDKCCGDSVYGCGKLDGQCDWCASQNHPHFDLDNTTFNIVCNDPNGSCELTTVKPFKCIIPQKIPSGGNYYTHCPNNSWDTGTLGPVKDGSCTSNSYYKPDDPDWPDSSGANHWCCKIGSGGSTGYVQCPANSWDTGTMGPGAAGSCTSNSYYKPGDSNWPNSSNATHWCCKTM
jgi:hypothetical protein